MQGDLIAYVRSHEGQRVLVALNLGADPHAVSLPGEQGTIRVSTHLDRDAEGVSGEVNLRANEGVLIELRGSESR
jgi:alpha-glucosidase